jgi:hypothetical protein
MPRINVKLNDVETSGFEVYPEDTYKVEITDKSQVKTSKEGNPKIGWMTKILDGEFEGKYLYWETSLLPQALWNLKALLEAIEIGWDEDGFELEDTFGAILLVDVETKKFEGEPRNNIVKYHKS